MSLVHSSGLVSPSLPHESSCSLSFFFLVVYVFQFFSKELWICRWWAAPVPEAGPPCGRAGTRGRPTAAERISVFKAFENKLLQFPGCRVGAGRGVPGGGFAWSPGRRGSHQVRRVSRSTSPCPPPVWLELAWAPCPSQASALGAS